MSRHRKPKCILLDIEGTTSSISFVHDVMFPYVRENLVQYLDENWERPSVQDCLPLLAEDAGLDSIDALVVPGESNEEAKEKVASVVNALMDGDVKATGLKKLQGQIWKAGFESGNLVAHLYEDVVDAIDGWLQQDIEIRIYSSGSVQAQQLFFGHTVQGNLLSKFSGHYDTTVGPKKETGSYSSIAADVGLPPEQMLFISDVAAELDAAKSAGMNVRLSIRPGNEPVENVENYDSISDFRELIFVEETA